MRLRVRVVPALVVTVGLSFSGCRCQDDESTPVAATPAGVTHCLNGIQRAVQASTVAETTAIYYDECADLFSEAACRDGWHAAARLPDVDGRLAVAAMACRKAYCPAFSAFGFGICKEDFVPVPLSVMREWPPLFDAILAREAGSAATDLAPALLGFISHVAQLAQAAPASASAPAPAASLGAPAVTGSVPSASAAPPIPPKAVGSAKAAPSAPAPPASAPKTTAP